jgi:hypothetical protein
MTEKFERFVDALEVYIDNNNRVKKIVEDNTQLINSHNDIEHKYNTLLDDAECVLCYFLDKPDLDPNRESTLASLLSGAVSEPPKYTKKDFLVAYERLVKTIHTSYQLEEDDE